MRLVGQSKGILTATFASGKVAFCPTRRMPYSLNPTAAEIWEFCRRPRTRAAIIGHLCNTYGIDAKTARRDLDRLIAALKRRGLVKTYEHQ